MNNRPVQVLTSSRNRKIDRKEDTYISGGGMIPLEVMQPPHSLVLVFPGLKIRLHPHRVLKDGTDINLTHLEYGAFCYLAANLGRGGFTKALIFETVWSMEKMKTNCFLSYSLILSNIPGVCP